MVDLVKLRRLVSMYSNTPVLGPGRTSDDVWDDILDCIGVDREPVSPQLTQAEIDWIHGKGNCDPLVYDARLPQDQKGEGA